MLNYQKLRFAALIAGFVATSASVPAAPAPPPAEQRCRGVVVLDTIYSHADPGGKNFEYFAQLRSTGSRLVTVRVELAGFPPEARLVSRMLTVSLGPGQNDAVRLGSGPDARINDATVRKAYDGSPASTPYVMLSNCRVQ